MVHKLLSLPNIRFLRLKIFEALKCVGHQPPVKKSKLQELELRSSEMDFTDDERQELFVKTMIHLPELKFISFECD